MKFLKQLILGFGLLALVGCSQIGGKKAFVTMEIVNASSKPLNWVKVMSGDRQLFSAGILVPSAEKTHVDYVWSNMPDQAKLTFIDDQTRKPYSIDVSLKDADAQVISGQCKRVTIRILGYDQAEVVLR